MTSKQGLPLSRKAELCGGRTLPRVALFRSRIMFVVCWIHEGIEQQRHNNTDSLGLDGKHLLQPPNCRESDPTLARFSRKFDSSALHANWNITVQSWVSRLVSSTRFSGSLTRYRYVFSPCTTDMYCTRPLHLVAENVLFKHKSPAILQAGP